MTWMDIVVSVWHFVGVGGNENEWLLVPMQRNEGSPAYWLPGPVFSAGKKYGQDRSTS